MVEQAATLDISIAQQGALTDEEIANLVTLINSVYKEAEAGMWKDNFQRTTVEEIKGFISENKLMIAKLEGQIIGSSVVEKQVEDSIGKFGMLVVDPNLRGKRFGAALVREAEDWAKKQGLKTMKCELLTPKEWSHPSKVFLHTWYTRIGYVPQPNPKTLLDDFPHLVDSLECSCILTDYLKPLSE